MIKYTEKEMHEIREIGYDEGRQTGIRQGMYISFINVLVAVIMVVLAVIYFN